MYVYVRVRPVSPWGCLLRSGPPPRDAVVVQAKQLDDLVDVPVRADPSAHPSRIGKNVMWFGSPGRDELVASRLWEREVGEAVTVHVAELDPPEPELHSSETMGMARDAFPGANRLVDAATGVHARVNAADTYSVPAPPSANHAHQRYGRGTSSP